ncbi:MAG: AAA family ATPase [Clostridia bacterium]|nr:AAA family ATPase [Clostridia bacterium]
MSFKISLAGDLGSGKSTVSRLLIEATGAEYYSTGKICRAAAAEHGMTIDEFNKYMETHPEVDKQIDDGLAALSADSRSLIIDSRMAFHFVRPTFRVYLTTDARTSAERIRADRREGESFATIEETARRVAARRESENLRYFEKYGVHIMDMQNYDLILDTTAIPPARVAELILSSLALWQEDGSRRFCYLDYRRFMSADAPSAVGMTAKARALSLGDTLPLPTVWERGGAYYLAGGTDTVLAHRIAGRDIVPCRLLPTPADTTDTYRPLFEE